MGGIMLLLCMFGALAWYACTPIFPDRVTTRLHKGMSAPEVEWLLGMPQSVRELKSGRTEWRYTAQIRSDFCVEIDPDGTVQYFYEHD